MAALRDRSSLVIFALLASAVYATEVLAVRLALSRVARPDLLAAAVAFDLVVVVPAAYWWLCVRARAPAWRVLPVVAASLAGAALVLPAGHDGVVRAVRWLAAPAELVVVWLVARRALRALRDPTAADDVVERLRGAARGALPHRAVAEAVAYEMALLWFALGSWRVRAPEGADTFSTHRRSGYGGIVFALALGSAGEAVAVHLLVAPESEAMAWTLTALSLYGMVWLAGDWRAVRLRPLRVDAEGLHVRVGLRWSVVVPWAEVASVEPRGRGALPDGAAGGWLRATPVGEPRLVVELRSPVEARGPYGITRRVRRIGVAVDDEARFLGAVAEHLAARG